MFTVREEVVNNVSVYRIEDSFDAAAKRIVKYTTNIIDVDEMSLFHQLEDLRPEEQNAMLFYFGCLLNWDTA